MTKILGNIVLALTLLAVAGPRPLEATHCDTRYRIWQNGNNTFFKYGEVIVLRVGEKADLYIHAYPSRSEHPYSASADIGAPTAFRVGGQRPQDVSRVLRLGKHEPRKGKISFTTIAAGETALGYRITDVVRPGRLDKVSSGCRVGQVRITVQAATPDTHTHLGSTPPSQSANDAAHQLIVQLYTGILRRPAARADDYPDSYFDRVQRTGVQGLISIAEAMTSSPEFKTGAITRTRRALAKSGISTDGLTQGVLENQLLTDIFASLYGSGSAPYADAQRRMASSLSTCLSGRGGDSCQRLGRDLLAQPQYQGHNRDLLRTLR